MSEGNAGRIADYFKSEYQRMVGYVRARLYEVADRDSEDIVSDVMARIFDRADISAPIENLGAYIYRSLKNHVIDILRKNNDWAISLDEDDAFTDRDPLTNDKGNPQSDLEKKEITAALYEEVMCLPEDLRSVYMMNEIDGKTYREISELTGIPAGTLMTRKARAIDRLRQKLSHFKIYLED